MFFEYYRDNEWGDALCEMQEHQGTNEKKGWSRVMLDP